MQTEYQVRPVTRYVVTRYAKDSDGAASTTIGEFANGTQADTVADAMVSHDLALGIESIRTRHGLSMGEALSGNRIQQELEQ